MSISRLTGAQMLVSLFSSSPVVFDNPGISKFPNVFLLRPHLWFIKGFICDLFAEHSDSSFVYGFMCLDYGLRTMTAHSELEGLHADRTNICFYHHGS